MMTQQVGFSILSAPLAAIDRRSLSQAWYSALHLARDPQRSHVPVHARATPAQARAKTLAVNPVAASRTSNPGLPVPRAERRTAARPQREERRAERSPLARRIERRFLNPCRRIERASFIVGSGSARIHVALQRVNGRVRLVAVCAPPLRAAVSRALEEARYALAARGIALEADVREAGR